MTGMQEDCIATLQNKGKDLVAWETSLTALELNPKINVTTCHNRRKPCPYSRFSFPHPAQFPWI
jgi:hypothetical protein